MNELKQEKYVLTINSENVLSTDKRFSMDNLEAGDNYKPLDVYMEKANGEIVRRYYTKGERRLSNQTMARIAFQAFEREVAYLHSRFVSMIQAVRLSVEFFPVWMNSGNIVIVLSI